MPPANLVQIEAGDSIGPDRSIVGDNIYMQLIHRGHTDTPVQARHDRVHQCPPRQAAVNSSGQFVARFGEDIARSRGYGSNEEMWCKSTHRTQAGGR